MMPIPSTVRGVDQNTAASTPATAQKSTRSVKESTPTHTKADTFELTTTATVRRHAYKSAQRFLGGPLQVVNGLRYAYVGVLVEAVLSAPEQRKSRMHVSAHVGARLVLQGTLDTFTFGQNNFDLLGPYRPSYDAQQHWRWVDRTIDKIIPSSIRVKTKFSELTAEEIGAINKNIAAYQKKRAGKKSLDMMQKHLMRVFKARGFDYRVVRDGDQLLLNDGRYLGNDRLDPIGAEKQQTLQPS